MADLARCQVSRLLHDKRTVDHEERLLRNRSGESLRAGGIGFAKSNVRKRPGRFWRSTNRKRCAALRMAGSASHRLSSDLPIDAAADGQERIAHASIEAAPVHFPEELVGWVEARPCGWSSVRC
jgi:hypothetical protein